MMKKPLPILITALAFCWAINNATACHITALPSATYIYNGNNTYIIKVSACLAINVNWGAVTSFVLVPGGGTYSTIDSIVTLNYTTSYNYCDSSGCNLMGGGCLGSMFSGGCVSGLSIISDSVKIIGCGNNDGAWLAPDDNIALCAGNPDSFCQDVTFITTGLPANITMYVVEGAQECIITKSITTLCDSTIYTDTIAQILHDGINCIDYPILKIGSQWWMKENVNATKYSNGDTLVNGTGAGNITGNDSTKYYFNYNDTVAYSAIYGKLYTWAAAMNGAASSDSIPSGVQGVCPTGWHLPSDAEWKQLEMNLGMSQASADSISWRGTDEGGQLKDTGTTYWTSPNTDATNSSGFTALPCGYRSTIGAFNDVGSNGLLWSSTEYNSSNAWYRVLTFSNSKIGRGGYNMSDGVGCRCVKDFISPCDTLALIFAIANITCNGLCNGIAAATVTGGVAPYTWLYQGSPFLTGPDTAIVPGFCAGTFSITVQDSLGCSVTDSFTITQPTAAIATSMTTLDSFCGDTCIGKATVSASGGTQPFSYLWNNGQTDTTATGLCALAYTVTVTDSMGCTKVDTANIASPLPITLSASLQNATCGLANGSAVITASGGFGAYTYLWSNGPTDSAATGLSAGAYSIIVTDNLGCDDTAYVTVTQIGAPALTIASTNATTCAGSDGTATATATGGTPPYTYLWSNGAASASLSGLSAGTYSLTMKDSLNCAVNKSVVITAPQPFTLTVAATTVSCSGGSDGTASLTVTGGMSPFTYLWSNMASTDTIYGVSAGTYTVTVTDDNSCISTFAATVSEKSALVVAVSVNQSLAVCGAANAVVTANVTGGTSPYKYQWSDGDTLAIDSGLGAGIHYAKVTDALGCIAYGTVNISDGGAPGISDSVTHIKCSGSKGAIDITVTGGNPPYTYNWSTGAASQDLISVNGGIYEIVITDSAGCIASKSIVVNEPQPVSVIISKTEASCGAADGSAALIVSGGTAPYIYSWSTGSADSLKNAAAGIYSVAISDANNCLAARTVVISNAGGPVVSVDSVTQTSCASPLGGAINITVTGGKPPYTYLWSDSTATEDRLNLKDTLYNLLVTDSNNCITAVIVNVERRKPVANPICIVTVDSATGSNLIVWEKPALALQLSYFKIYKEGTQSGVYNFVDSVMYNAPVSEYIDLVSNPQKRSWRYKLTSVDSCGIESDFSPVHKTMHLTINLGLNNAINLIWDHYAGFVYYTYIIYRGNGSTVDSIDAISSNSNSYTDINPPTGTLSYQVAAVLNGAGCVSGKVKNYSSSKSNTSTSISVINTVSEIGKNGSYMAVYPNPNRGMFTLDIGLSKTENVQLRIFDILGQLVTYTDFGRTTGIISKQIDLSGNKGGIYYIQVITDGGTSVQKVVVE